MDEIFPDSFFAVACGKMIDGNAVGVSLLSSILLSLNSLRFCKCFEKWDFKENYSRVLSILENSWKTAKLFG